MSKIQDALRKLQYQKADSGATTPKESAVGTRVIGEKVDELDETGVLKQPEDGGLIVLDYVSLRSEGYLAPVNQERYVAEQYRMLKRPLLDNAFGNSTLDESVANLIMVSSALPGDGKTFNCINLALSMAVEKDVSVLLVDADVAKPHVSRLFGVDTRPGLTDLLKDKSLGIDRCVLRTNVEGLRVLPAGSPDEQSTELLASRRMEEVIGELSSTYSNRVVIFDSPPLLVTSEARVLASYMGQIAMVVCAGRTPQQAVLDALASLDETKAINLILNQAGSTVGRDGYGSYQYAYGQ